MCDRCPSEVDVTEGPAANATQWTGLHVQTGRAPAKHVLLCPECARSFRLFMLGASERTTSSVGERWENIVCGAV